MNGVTLNHMLLETQHWQLLPGINDAITLNQITPKLSWRDFFVLSLVSRGWCHAIRTRQVYDARVGQRSTEKLVLIEHGGLRTYGITMFDMRDYSFYQLPPLPDFTINRIRFYNRCACVALNGKVYVLVCDGNVYAMDLAGQGKWTQCASREKPRKVNCSVMQGKIYGLHDSSNAWPQVFDPARNSWSVIKRADSPAKCYVKSITTVGEELFMYGIENATSIWQVYNPAKDEWRKGDSPDLQASFLRQGKFHAFVRRAGRDDYSVITFDAEKNSWKNLGSSSFRVVGQTRWFVYEVVAVLAMDDGELLAIVVWLDNYKKHIGTYKLLRSVGFGSHCTEIMWQRVEVSPSSVWPCSIGCSMSSIEL